MEIRLERGPAAAAAVTVVAAAAWVVTASAPNTMDMGAVPFLASWTAMMTAMMLPSAAPFLLLYRRAASGAGTAALGAGYLFVWAVFGVAAYWFVVDGPMLPAWSVLALAGLYQLTPLKTVCLRRCRTPADFLVRRFGRPPLRLGVEHGAWCAGCCWALMLVLVAVGSMGLAWAAGIAAVVLLEKVAPRGEVLARAGGLCLVVLAFMEGLS